MIPGAVPVKDGAEAEPSASPAAFAGALADAIRAWEGHIKMPGFADAVK